MKQLIRVSVLVAILAAACSKGGTEGHAEEGHDHDHEGEGHGEKEGHDEKKGSEGAKHEDEVHLSAEAIERAGIVVSPAERRALTGGVAIPAMDGLIAATARRHGLHVATRDTRDFDHTGAMLFNPWDDETRKRKSR